MVRPWGFVTLTGTAQPVFATTLAAAFTPVTDGFGNPLPTQLGQPAQTLSLTLGTNFRANDNILIVNQDGTNPEFCQIATISGNNITCNAKKTHPSGAWVILAQDFTSGYIQVGDGNAGKVGLGTSKSVALTGGAGNTLFMVLEIPTGGQPPEFSSANIFGSNPKHSEELWAIGTASDTILPSIEST
jgi:hypothetical protein